MVQEFVKPLSELYQAVGLEDIVFILLLAALAFYFVKVWPEDRKRRQTLEDLMVEQVALSRQALETSNEVIRSNTTESAKGRASHERLGEKVDQLCDLSHDHDRRAQEMAQTLAVLAAREV